MLWINLNKKSFFVHVTDFLHFRCALLYIEILWDVTDCFHFYQIIQLTTFLKYVVTSSLTACTYKKRITILEPVVAVSSCNPNILPKANVLWKDITRRSVYLPVVNFDMYYLHIVFLQRRFYGKAGLIMRLYIIWRYKN